MLARIFKRDIIVRYNDDERSTLSGNNKAVRRRGGWRGGGKGTRDRIDFSSWEESLESIDGILNEIEVERV